MAFSQMMGPGNAQFGAAAPNYSMGNYGGGPSAQDPMSMMGSMWMSMMSMMMAVMAAGLMRQLMSGQSDAAFAPGANPGFGGNGGGTPSLGDSSGAFLGGGAAAKGGGSASKGGGAAPAAAGTGTGAIGAPTGQLVERPGGRLDSSIVANFDAMVAAAKKDGIQLQISSAHRSRAEQERLYAAYKNGTGNLAARPGTSNHEKGQAVDFKNTPGAHAWLARNAERFGFKNLPGEPWHYSPNGR